MPSIPQKPNLTFKDVVMFTDANTRTSTSNTSSSSSAIYSKAYDINKAISRAQDSLLSKQDKDGYWVFELEDD